MVFLNLVAAIGIVVLVIVVTTIIAERMGLDIISSALLMALVGVVTGALIGILFLA